MFMSQNLLFLHTSLLQPAIPLNSLSSSVSCGRSASWSRYLLDCWKALGIKYVLYSERDVTQVYVIF